MIQKSSFWSQLLHTLVLTVSARAGGQCAPTSRGRWSPAPGLSGQSQRWKWLLRDAFNVTFGETFMTETNRNSHNKGRRQTSELSQAWNLKLQARKLKDNKVSFGLEQRHHFSLVTRVIGCFHPGSNVEKNALVSMKLTSVCASAARPASVLSAAISYQLQRRHCRL